MAPAAESSVMESDQEKGQVDPDRAAPRGVAYPHRTASESAL